jgi:integrase
MSAKVTRLILLAPAADVQRPSMLDRQPTKSDTWEEIENVISALVDHLECQLILALAPFLGLRRNEIAAL